MPNTTPRPKTTTQKGLGHDHQVHRRRLMTRHVDGTRCWWCGRKMFRDRTRNWDYDPHATRVDGKPDWTSGALSADHERPRSVYGSAGNQADRLLHGICNKQRGDGSRDDQRPALSGIAPEDLEPDEALGALVLAWP